MRAATKLMMAVIALATAQPALADVENTPGNWYRIGVSNDGAEVYYMDVDFAKSHTRAGMVGVGVPKNRRWPPGRGG